ncbi:hypothetical protein JKF63_01344 [Porcisia hertigi]|uniref:Uncharacterized protein n=1 Tax=Porcisia hertigi TaxID=2761500 RepID=A0A836HHH4_9TRYP|nr:hypothetical protein JKF63_01344 [Porcisia hertigi]
MQRYDCSAYRETLLYARELALLFPSLWSEILSSNAVAAASSSLANPTSLTSLASIKPVEPHFLTQWMAAATTAPVAYHCCPTNDKVEGVDHVADVVVVRWTRVLGMWIALRVVYLSSRCEEVLAPEEEGEVVRYRQYFLPLAWPMLDLGIQERLASCLCALAEKRGASQPKSGTICASGVSASSLCSAVVIGDDEGERVCDEVCTRAMEATQRVAREYLRIGWDVLHPNSVPATVDAKLNRLAAQQSRLGCSEVGSFEARSVLVPTSCLGNLLKALVRLRLQLQRPPVHHSLVLCFTLAQKALLQVGYDLLTKVRACLIERCYYLLPTMLDYEFCVLLCDAIQRESAELQRQHTELARVQAVLHNTLRSFLKSVFDLYHDVIETLLTGYKKKSASTLIACPAPRLVKVLVPLLSVNPSVGIQEASQDHPAPTAACVSKPPTYRGAATERRASAVMRLSEPAFSVLVEALEPTCDLLQRHLSALNALSTRSLTSADEHDQGTVAGSGLTGEGEFLPPLPPQEREVSGRHQLPTALVTQRELIYFLAEKMSNSFADAAAGSGMTAKSAQQQAAADAYLTAAYLSVYGPH